MITSKTYVVGPNGSVKRLTNMTGPWADVPVTNSIAAAATLDLLDVMTDPNDINKVFAVGEGMGTGAARGIYYSTNAGGTWNVPGGTYQTNEDINSNLRWSEVWVIDSDNIVVAGDNGYIARSTDGGLIFNLCTQLPSVVEVTGDPAVTPNCLSVHWITDRVGVTGTRRHVFKTTNGGNTWVTLNSGAPLSDGSVLADNITGVHMSSDGSTITALASNRIFRSTDNGLTWSVVYTFPSAGGVFAGRHLTWVDDQNMVAVGAGTLRIETTDGGATWSVLSPFNMFGEEHLAGHLYQAGNGFYGDSDEVYRTFDKMVTGTPSTPFPLPAAMWVGWQPPVCYNLTPCGGGNPITVSSNLQYAVGQVINVCPEDFIGNGGTPSPLPIAGQMVNPNDHPVGTKLWYLTPCCGVGQKFSITNNMAAYNGWSINIPNQPGVDPNQCYSISSAGGNDLSTPLGGINLSGAMLWQDCLECRSVHDCSGIAPVILECGCYEVSLSPDPECNSNIQLTVFPGTSADCETCNQKPCYALVDCTDPTNFIISDTPELFLHLNKVVKLQYSDVCWRVVSSVNCTGSVAVQPVTESFDSCTECLPAPEPSVVDLSYRSIRPGYDTPGCDPVYTEKVNCKFADQYYQKMVSERYGINFCCPQDLDKWDVKKSLLDLNAIYNEDQCQSSFSRCCPPECVEVSIVSFNPVSCPGPSGVTAELDYPTDCIAPENVVVDLDFPALGLQCDCYQIDTGKGNGFNPTATYRICGARAFTTITLDYDTSTFVCTDTYPQITGEEYAGQVHVNFVSTNCLGQGCGPA